MRWPALIPPNTYVKLRRATMTLTTSPYHFGPCDNPFSKQTGFPFQIRPYGIHDTTAVLPFLIASFILIYIDSF